VQLHLTQDDWQLQLISLYCWIHDGFFHRGWSHLVQRFSNNQTQFFTDPELLTVYLYARVRGHHMIKNAWRFARDFLTMFFPSLPQYQPFTDRLHRLTPVLLKAIEESTESKEDDDCADFLADSCPLQIAQKTRASRARVGREVAGTSYCASKQMWYYGLKLHIVARRRIGTMPQPVWIGVSSANTGDIKGLEALKDELNCGRIFADLAYKSEDLHMDLQERGCQLVTPRKRTKGKFHFKGKDIASNAVSRVRQPIETLFSWLQAKTQIQNLSHLRSTKGVMFYVWSSMLVGLLLMH